MLIFHSYVNVYTHFQNMMGDFPPFFVVTVSKNTSAKNERPKLQASCHLQETCAWRLDHEIDRMRRNAPGPQGLFSCKDLDQAQRRSRGRERGWDMR